MFYFGNNNLRCICLLTQSRASTRQNNPQTSQPVIWNGKHFSTVSEKLVHSLGVPHLTWCSTEYLQFLESRSLVESKNGSRGPLLSFEQRICLTLVQWVTSGFEGKEENPLKSVGFLRRKKTLFLTFSDEEVHDTNRFFPNVSNL